jgi:MurNAc alpha-1-phosphate uridylyltransferase
VAIYSREFFTHMQPGKMPLRPLLDGAIERGCLGGEYHKGWWEDVGTPQRLQALDVAARSTGQE